MKTMVQLFRACFFINRFAFRCCLLLLLIQLHHLLRIRNFYRVDGYRDQLTYFVMDATVLLTLVITLNVPFTCQEQTRRRQTCPKKINLTERKWFALPFFVRPAPISLAPVRRTSRVALRRRTFHRRSNGHY